MSTPEKVWINGVNLSGIWFKAPRRATWSPQSKSWWDAEGNFSVQRLGEDGINPRAVTYASESKIEAEAWTLGAWAVANRLKGFLS